MTLVALNGYVRPDWVDDNLQMSPPFFAIAFAEANNAAMEALHLGPTYTAATDCTLCVVEAKYNYRRELRACEPFHIRVWPAGVNEKRLCLTYRMIREDGPVVAEAEVLFLNVSREGATASPFPPATRARLSELAALAHLRSPAA